MASVVPAGMSTLAGSTGGGGGGGTGEIVGPEGCGTGAPAAGGVVVLVMAWAVWPCAGGWTTVVVVVPLLSTVTTCCGWPVLAACALAWSMAACSFDPHPETMAAARTSVSGKKVWAEKNLPEWVMPEWIMGVSSFTCNAPPAPRAREMGQVLSSAG